MDGPSERVKKKSAGAIFFQTPSPHLCALLSIYFTYYSKHSFSLKGFKLSAVTIWNELIGRTDEEQQMYALNLFLTRLGF